MSCREAETTTLLWLYGEGSEDQIHHISGCADCRAVVAEHEAVASDIADILPVIRRPDAEWSPAPASAPASAKPSALNDDRGWIRWIAAGGAAAALLLVGSQVALAPDIALAPVQGEEVAFADPFYGDLDAELDDLDYLVDTLVADVSIL